MKKNTSQSVPLAEASPAELASIFRFSHEGAGIVEDWTTNVVGFQKSGEVLNATKEHVLRVMLGNGREAK
jgi:hypothetical protein